MLSLVEASMLPSHYYVPAIIEGVFLPRNSIPRIGIRSRQKWGGYLAYKRPYVIHPYHVGKSS